MNNLVEIHKNNIYLFSQSIPLLLFLKLQHSEKKYSIVFECVPKTFKILS